MCYLTIIYDSIRLIQGLYQNGKLCATAETIIVQMDEVTRGSKPLSDSSKEILEQKIIK